MRGTVLYGPRDVRSEKRPDPTIVEPTDAIIRLAATCVCGSDLWPYRGIDQVAEPMPMGHEYVGIVEEVGSEVRQIKPGQFVVGSFFASDNTCEICRSGYQSSCVHRQPGAPTGAQAEYARIPFVDTSAYKVPESLTDEQVLFLADILPTSFEVGVLNGRVKPGDVVAIVGAGPIGLAAVLTAKLFTPAKIVVLDVADKRLELAKSFGADVTINNGTEDAVARIMELTGGLGADVAIEAVGVPATFELCTELVRPGGTVANVGVHGHPVTLHLEKLWIRGVTMTTGLVDTFSTPTLLKLIAQGRLDGTPFTTHRFKLSEAMDAYDVFGAAAETNALKVVLEGEKAPLKPKERLAAAVA